jgi:diguanylate cyclase (GGDEF)-like protein
MLAGYAVVPSTGWGIVAQRPTEAVLASLNGLMWETVTHALPFLLFSLLCIWLLAKRIASPLSQLAHATNHMDEPDAPDRIEAIDSWYLEARQIKAALLAALMKIGRRMNKLRLDSFTDSLTGLLNRRGFEEELAIGELTGTPIAVIAIDIDHFKVINDTFGHHAGDEVIQAIAAITNKYSRVDDRLARVGGEEFVMLLPNVAVEQAVIIAERIRKEVEVSSAADPHGPYAISLGVACVPMHGTSLRKVVDRADEALYEAKRTGRNRVCMAAT